MRPRSVAVRSQSMRGSRKMGCSMCTAHVAWDQPPARSSASSTESGRGRLSKDERPKSSGDARSGDARTSLGESKDEMPQRLSASLGESKDERGGSLRSMKSARAALMLERMHRCRWVINARLRPPLWSSTLEPAALEGRRALASSRGEYTEHYPQKRRNTQPC
eukprot:scaffold109567_cov66-Phaeocystis_antarctica.AAC.4